MSTDLFRRWTELWRGSVIDPGTRQNGHAEVYVTRWRRYVLSVVIVGATTLVVFPLASFIAPTNMVMLYLVAVVVAAIYLGRGPSIVVAILGVLALDFFYVPPHFTFAVADTQYLLTFVGLLIVGLVISALTARVREQAETAKHREKQTMQLYEFSRDLAAAFGLDEILQSVVNRVAQSVGQVAILLPEGKHLKLRKYSPGLTLTKDELAVATWTFEHGEYTGYSPDVPDAANIRCIPLKTVHGIVGVLAINPPISPIALSPQQQRLLESFASQAALAIERAQFAEQVRQAQVVQATEKLQTALLNSISHDLRTPLVSITGTLSSLQDANGGVQLDDITRQGMVETAYGEARRLNHIVGNLLDMTRIEAGAIHLRQELGDVQDVIGSALEQLSDRLKGRKVIVDLRAPLPLVPMDFVLIVQVIVNLVENAVKYSPGDEPIEIQACAVGAHLEIQVADRGIGIPTEDLTHVFDKFYRVQRPDGVSGTGLGLAICKGIVEAHRGQIRAANRAGGGTTMIVTLPLQAEG